MGHPPPPPEIHPNAQEPEENYSVGFWTLVVVVELNVDVWEVTIGFGNQLARLPVRQLLLDFNKASTKLRPEMIRLEIRTETLPKGTW
ncbi:hypothetical protein RUM43_008704 [Polyplax serrata]|uniref:Uncharacterized protein n=1 Tax=Polyplax serrata TaxID=468196 RepID=A0AAN8NUR4_POLSC